MRAPSRMSAGHGLRVVIRLGLKGYARNENWVHAAKRKHVWVARAGCRFPGGLPAADTLGLMFSFLTHWGTFERIFFFFNFSKPLFCHLYNGNNILTL